MIFYPLATLFFMKVSGKLTQSPQLPATYALYEAIVSKNWYYPHIKPRLNASDAVNVDVFLAPMALVAMDEVQGQLTMTFYLEMKWRDEILKWDPMDYNGTTCLFLPTNKIWVPNLQFIINNVFRDLATRDEDPVYICHDGSAVQILWKRVTVSSEFDVTEFPFDQQKVGFHIGHDVYGNTDLKPHSTLRTMDQVKEKGYTINQSPSWQILDYQCLEEIFEYDSEIYSTYTAVSCHLKISRRPAYYIVNFCIPSIFVTFLSLIGIHCISLATRERKSKFGQLAMTSIVSLSVLTLTIADGMPRTNEGVSRFHIFYYSLLALILIAMVIALVGLSCAASWKNSKAADCLDTSGLVGNLMALIALCLWFFSSALLP